MTRWNKDGIMFQIEPPRHSWKVHGVDFQVKRAADDWNPREHPRDRRGRFADKFGTQDSPSAPEAAAPSGKFAGRVQKRPSKDHVEAYRRLGDNPGFSTLAKFEEDLGLRSWDRMWLGRHVEIEDEERKYANSKGIDKAELDNRRRQALGQKLAGKPVAVRVTPTELGKILSDGRFKSQFETGRSKGRKDLDMRARFEAMQFGYDVSIPDADRPIYGYVYADEPRPSGVGAKEAGDLSTDALSQYGEVQVVLKNSVRDRSTVTVGDSLTWSRSSLPSPLNAPEPYSLPTAEGGMMHPLGGQDALEWDPSGPAFKGESYVESQIHGGLPVSDIDHVLLAKSPPKALAEQLDKAGVKWRVFSNVTIAKSGTAQERRNALRVALDDQKILEKQLARERASLKRGPDNGPLVRSVADLEKKQKKLAAEIEALEKVQEEGPSEAAPEPKPATPDKPVPAASAPLDKLGRAIQPGARITTNGLTGVVARASGDRVQVQWDRNGKKSTTDASGLTVIAQPDGGRVGGDGLPTPTPASELKPGDRIFQSAKTGYVVTGEPRPSGYNDFLLVPVRDLDGKPEELALYAEEPQIVYPEGMELPGETLRRQAAAEKPSTLKPGQKFSFGVPGMDGPVYTVESVSEPRQVTNKWIDDRGKDRSRTFMAVDLVMRTADGDQVSGTFEDNRGARINHSPKPVQGPPFVPARVVKVGDVLADPENREGGNLTVTAITGEPQMSTSQTGWSLVTHDRLLTLRDEQGNIRKIYNRTDWAGVQRVSQVAPPQPPVLPEPPTPTPTPVPASAPAPARATKGEALGVPAVRPVLYTEDREEIFKMGFEKDPGYSQNVKDAVARLRARQTISAPQASELADAVRAYNQRSDIPDKKRRTNARAANWLDAAAAEIEGREQPDLAVQTSVEKVKAADLAVGDTVALVGRDRSVDVVTVRGVKSNTWGVTTLNVEHSDGREEAREVLSKANAYLLPDPPPPTPETPAENNRREHVHPSDLRLGDITDREGKLHQVTAVTQKSPWAWSVTYQPSEEGAQAFTTEYRSGFGYPAAIRVRRSPGSTQQPWTGLMPPENPTPISSSQVKLGDRIEVDLRSGPRRGTVIEIDEPRSDGKTRVAIIVTDDGERRSTVIDGERPITRLVDSDGNGSARVQQLQARASINNRTQEVAQILDKHRKAARDYAAGVADNTVWAPSAAGALREMAAKREGLPFIKGRGAEEVAKVLVQGSTPEIVKQITDRLRPTLDEFALREYLTLADALDANRPLPGEDEEQAARRLIAVAKTAPIQTDNQQAARVLAELIPELQAEGQALPGDVPLPDIPEGADLGQRIAAYREFIGGSGSNFGKHRVTRTTLRTPSVEDLEAGIAPHTEKVTEWAKEPRAADGGPGPVTMQQLAAVQAAGRDLSQLLEERVDEPIRKREREIREEMDGFNRRVSSLMDEEWRNTHAFQEEYAREHGYRDWASMDIAAYKARRSGDDDEAFRIEELMDQLGEKARQNASTREAQAKASEEFRRLANEQTALGTTRKALQRKEVLDLVSQVRGEPMGDYDMDFDFVGPEAGDSPGRVQEITDEDREELAQAMGFAVESYPASWLAHITNTYKIKKSRRGYHRNDGTVIALSPDSTFIPSSGRYGATAVHELGHGMEIRVPGLVEAESAFLWQRTATGEVGSRNRPDPTTIYRGTREVGWKDDFKEHYTGRYYGNDKGFEVFTTGYEDLVGGGGGDYVDGDFRDWVLGVMALL
jgi:hypothetical protein